MFSHPVAVIGYCAIGLGMLAAFMASGMSYGDAGLAFLIGNALIGLGGFMVLLGVIAQGFLRVEKHLAGIPGMKAAFDAYEKSKSAPIGDVEIAPRDTSRPVDPEELKRKLREKGLRA